MMLPRAGLVAVLALGVALATRLYRSRRAGMLDHLPEHPLVPAVLRAGAERTWVVFTTPYCATCGPVETSLRESDPGVRVVKVDATCEPALARAFLVRSAPTAVLADAEGRVRERLVGPEAVQRWVAARA